MSLTVNGKGENWINVTFDGSTDFDLCAYLGVKAVTLYLVTQPARATNDTLTVRNGSATAVAMYGPFKDVNGGGLALPMIPRVCKPFVVGSETTSGGMATFEVEYVTE